MPSTAGRAIVGSPATLASAKTPSPTSSNGVEQTLKVEFRPLLDPTPIAETAEVQLTDTELSELMNSVARVSRRDVVSARSTRKRAADGAWTSVAKMSYIGAHAGGSKHAHRRSSPH